METKIPRTAKSSSSAAPPSLLSGMTPPPPGQQLAAKIQTRQGGPQPHQMLQQPQRQHHPQQPYQQGGAQHHNPPPPNQTMQLPTSTTEFSRQYSPPTINVNAALNPLPLPSLSDAQKKTLRHLDTLVEVVSNKIADQMERNKQIDVNSTESSGGIGSGSRENKRQREQQGNFDVFGSFITNEDNRYDFFDTDPTTNAILVPPLPNRSIPIFPEEFPPGKKEWPLSWWGICHPSSGLLALHEKMANDLGFPIKKRGVPSAKKKDDGRDSVNDSTRENDRPSGMIERTSSLEERSGSVPSRDDRLGTKETVREPSSEHRMRERTSSDPRNHGSGTKEPDRGPSSSEHRRRERTSSDPRNHGSRGAKEQDGGPSSEHRRRERTSMDSRNHGSVGRKKSDPSTATEHRKRERSNSDSRRSRDSSKHKRHRSTERNDDSRRNDSDRRAVREDKRHRGESRSRDKSHRDKRDKDNESTKSVEWGLFGSSVLLLVLVSEDPHTKVDAMVRAKIEAIETIEIKATTALMAGKGVVSRTLIVSHTAGIIFIEMKVVVLKAVRRVLRVKQKATATRAALVLKAEREVAVKILMISLIKRTKSILMNVFIVLKAKREAIKVRVTVVPIAEAIELNVAKEISPGKSATAALRTNILTDMVTAQTIFGRDRVERCLVAIDVLKDIMENCTLTKGIFEKVSLEIGTPPIIEMWANIVVVLVLTPAVPILTDQVEIWKADFATRVFAETVATIEANGAMRGMEIVGTVTNVVQRERVAGVAILPHSQNYDNFHAKRFLRKAKRRPSSKGQP
ncbi:hypothetical protein ACHAW5_003858 [Stephanodiscus triporus]|uniref:Uncharacterized protein n=1 Tax=Stephanodiscus triporus TaxID=2934178 RepID=A0ABD3NRF1_9STRA